MFYRDPDPTFDQKLDPDPNPTFAKNRIRIQSSIYSPDPDPSSFWPNKIRLFGYFLRRQKKINIITLVSEYCKTSLILGGHNTVQTGSGSDHIILEPGSGSEPLVRTLRYVHSFGLQTFRKPENSMTVHCHGTDTRW